MQQHTTDGMLASARRRQRIAILGSTGSIGTQTLDVVRAYPDLFEVEMLAAGSIIFLKIGNENYEDAQRYEILEKIGVSRKALGKAVRNEICFAYYCPFLLMTVTSYFSVKALGNIMREDLIRVNFWSALFVLILFTFICGLSVRRAKRRIFALRKER